MQILAEHPLQRRALGLDGEVSDGQEKSITLNVRVEDGDYEGVLDAAREMGGVWAISPEGEPVFLPWPCACVEVRVLEEP